MQHSDWNVLHPGLYSEKVVESVTGLLDCDPTVEYSTRELVECLYKRDYDEGEIGKLVSERIYKALFNAAPKLKGYFHRGKVERGAYKKPIQRYIWHGLHAEDKLLTGECECPKCHTRFFPEVNAHD